MIDPKQLAEQMVARAKALGAEEATATVSQGSHTTLIRRDGKVEQAQRSSTRGLVVSLLVEDRFSSHSTSDLRPDALESFLARAVDATRFIEPDPDRALPDIALCGRGVSEEQLDQWDPAAINRTTAARAQLAHSLEDAVVAAQPDSVISGAVYCGDGSSEAARVMSNGFSQETRGAWFSLGGELTLSDANGKRPEASAYYGARYLTDLPTPDAVAEEVVKRAKERLGSGSIASGTYPMLLENRVAGRLLGTLAGPLSGPALHMGRSCLAGKLGESIGSSQLTLLDDPTIPRGLGSRPWDGDALYAKPRTIIENGVLRSYYINVYYGRKLEVPPTTGGRSNWVVPPGERSFDAVAADLPKAILVTGFLGGNSNAVTGDFSFGIRGVLLEYGVPTASLSEMNVAGNVLEIFDRLSEVASDTWEYSSVRCPTLLFDDIQFSGT